LLRIWRLRPDRSLRRYAGRELRANRQIRGLAWTWEKLRRLIVNADTTLVVATAIGVHLPMVVFYLGREPGEWLSGAWQVSGVLVGLVITLIIFLLQSATTQSLRSEATFRAVLRRTGVLWPVTWALTFIAATAVAERFAVSTRDAGSVVETYALILFVIQVGLFAVAFLRAIRIVSPQGVAQELARQFRDGLLIAIEADFANRLATARMVDECNRENVTFGSFLASGFPVPPKRSGWVADIDIHLPRQLNDTRVGSYTTIAAQPGEHVSRESPLAVSDKQLGSMSRQLVLSAVWVRPRGRPPQLPIAVFNDAVDLARRALIDGSNVSQDLAVQLIADCCTAFYDAHALYGVEY
jgi:hypothetical protein